MKLEAYGNTLAEAEANLLRKMAELPDGTIFSKQTAYGNFEHGYKIVVEVTL